MANWSPPLDASAGPRLRRRVPFAEASIGWAQHTAAPTFFILAVAIAIGTGIAHVQSTASFWLVILWGSWTVSVVWAFSRPSFSIPFTVILAGMLFFVIVPATIHVVTGRTVVGNEDFGAGTTKAVQISALAQCAMLLGGILARAMWPAGPLKPIHQRLSVSRLDLAALLALGVGFVGFLLDVAVGGSNIHQFFAFTSNTGYGSFYSTGSTSGYFLALELVAGLGVILAVLRLTGAATRASRTVPLLVIAGSAVLLLGSGSRGRFLVPLLAAGLVWLKTTRRDLPLRQLTVVAVLLVFALSTVVAVLRRPAGERQLSTKNLTAVSIGTGGELFAPLAGLAQTVPSQVPYLNGSSYLETLVFPVPRALWHSKPTGEINKLTLDFDPENNGFAFPEFGEMYANFGLGGVVVGSILFGLLVEALWIRFAATQTVRGAIILSVIYAIVAQIFVRGDFAPMFVTYLGLLIATLFVCRRGSQALCSDAAPTDR